MGKNKLLFWGLILSLLFNIAFISSLGYHLWKTREGQKPPHNRVVQQKRFSFKRMRFTPDQRVRLREMRKKFPQSIWPLRKKLAEERRALGKLLMEEKPDTIRIDERLHRIGELQTKMEKEVVFQMLKERNVLNPEQRKQFFRIMEKHLDKNLHPPPSGGRLDREKYPGRIREFKNQNKNRKE